MYANYSDIGRILASKQPVPFEGNSVRGFVGLDGCYYVDSYATCILALYPNGDVRYFNNRYYSVTTSRLQNIIRATFPELHNLSARVVYDF